MQNAQYIEKKFRTYPRIIIDTAALMNVEGLKRFLQANSQIFRSKGSVIIVPKSVYCEIARHLASDDTEKSQKALEAYELLAENKDIFQTEAVPLTDEDLKKAFADRELLSDLSLHRADCGQLLITNDKKLSYDAVRLNLQASCKGHKVMACSLRNDGRLHDYDCSSAYNQRKVTVIEACAEMPAQSREAEAEAVTEQEQSARPAIHKEPPQKDGLDGTSVVVGGLVGITGTFAFLAGNKYLYLKLSRRLLCRH